MGHLIDSTMVQFRILNRRRGPAVQAPRAQADKFSYSRLAKETLEAQKDLDLFMDTVTALIVEGSSVIGIRTRRGHSISAKAVVVTTGTFMDGKIFIGDYDAPEGRLGEEGAFGLGDWLRGFGFRTARLKTGTPARVDRQSLDLSRLERQDGDVPIFPFSFDSPAFERAQMPCWIAYTNLTTHKIIRDNISRSPLYGGKIVGKGPRYCPSIEDKVIRFPDRDRHQIFIEPEGSGTSEVYLNGLSSSLPEDVQNAFIHSIEGLENARVMRPAYAVEYDFLPPTQLYPSLASKLLKGLYFAGQTNGTSGYEEAACQGLMAGINAALYFRGEQPLILGRNQAYIGVLIDDLVTKGTEEPYRMFTSRAEYRLNLRQDTADQRLTQIGYQIGLASRSRVDALEMKLKSIEEIKAILKSRSVNNANALEYLKRPECDIENLINDIPELGNYSQELRYQTEQDIKYDGYIKRQDIEVQRFVRLEGLRIPESFDYDSAPSLSSESREKLKRIRPASIGQAQRISGIRTSDIAVLLILLRRDDED